MMSFRCPLGMQIPRLLGLRKKPEYKQVFASLGSEWDSMHYVIKHDDQDVIPPEPKTNYRQKPSCRLAQHCLCGEHGDAVWALKLWLCQAMKKSLAGQSGKSMRGLWS